MDRILEVPTMEGSMGAMEATAMLHPLRTGSITEDDRVQVGVDHSTMTTVGGSTGRSSSSLRSIPVGINTQTTEMEG